MNLDGAFVAQTLGAPLNAPNRPIGAVVIDSRKVRAGDLFVALKGERADGHDFVAGALDKGAYCLVSRPEFEGVSGCLKVDDAEKALGRLAAAWRGVVNPQLAVFGITGSSGKTTVKEMLAAILRAQAGNEAVLATAGNLNNHLGLPLTILRLKPHHRFAVLEMGMNHFGELDYLTRIAAPDFALVNNALRAHVGCGFDGVADIAQAKSEIYAGLSAQGVGFYPVEDAFAPVFQAALAGKRAIGFGVETGDAHADKIRLGPFEGQFDVLFEGKRVAVTLPAPGRHNIHNAVAAVALALSAGVDAAAVSRGLCAFTNARGRLQAQALASGAWLIDDTYNANPDSMKAAIDVLAALPAPRILVMGAMGELGDLSPTMHAEVGAYARAKVERAFFLGADARHAALAMGDKGVFFDTRESLMAALRPECVAGAAVLVKGSRFMQMENIVAALADAPHPSEK